MRCLECTSWKVDKRVEKLWVSWKWRKCLEKHWLNMVLQDRQTSFQDVFSRRLCLLKNHHVSWLHLWSLENKWGVLNVRLEKLISALKNYGCLESDTSVLKNTGSRRFSKIGNVVFKTPFQDAYVSWTITMCLDWIYDLLEINEISWMYVLKSSQACWKFKGVLRVTKVSWKTLAQDGSPR